MVVENNELNEDIVNKIFTLNLFDEDYYLEKYPDVKTSGVGAFEHYMTKGFKEERNPSPSFDTKFYLDTNPDVRDAGVNPLIHYVLVGKEENRMPSAKVKYSKLNKDFEIIHELGLFDEDYYLEKYPDVKTSGVGAFEHYMTKGFKEERNPNSTFDTKFYLDTNPDVRDAGINPLIHYAKIGRHENRLPNSWEGFVSPSSTNSEKNFLTREMIINLEKSDVYYKGRWIYYKEVINIIKLLKDIDNILEVGPYKSPMIEGTDVIDVTDKFINEYPLKMNKFHMHDCMKIPYPIEDKKYDLIIACQVLEHLGLYGQQKQIFNEFERISNKVLISLPYKWFSPNMRDHHMIDEKMIDYWANNRKPVFQLIVNQRIIRIYEF